MNATIGSRDISIVGVSKMIRSLATPRAPREDSLDFWRGVACLIVVVFHSVYQPATPQADWIVHVAARMWIGVPIFFVISGYCITASADLARRTPQGPASFFRRRLRRIYPPCLIVLGLTAIITAVVDGVLWPGSLSKQASLLRPWWLDGWQWLGNATLIESWRYHVVGNPNRAYYLGHYWTLCYEEQFYIVTGAIIAFAPRYFFPLAALMTGVVGLIAAATGAYARQIDGFFFDGSWLLFAIGILVYWIANYGERAARISAILTLATTFGAMTYLGYLSLNDSPKSVPQQLLVASAFGIWLLTAPRGNSKLAAATVMKPLARLGRMSFSLYLVHFPITIFVHAIFIARGIPSGAINPWQSIIACLLISIPAAYAFFVLVECRFVSRRNVEVATESSLVEKVASVSVA